MANFISERELRRMRRDALRERTHEDGERESVHSGLREQLKRAERGTSRIRSLDLSPSRDLVISDTPDLQQDGFGEVGYKTVDAYGGSIDISKEMLELDRKLSVLRQSGTEALEKARNSLSSREGSFHAYAHGRGDVTGRNGCYLECLRRESREMDIEANRRDNFADRMRHEIGSERNKRDSYLDSTRKESGTERTGGHSLFGCQPHKLGMERSRIDMETEVGGRDVALDTQKRTESEMNRSWQERDQNEIKAGRNKNDRYGYIDTKSKEYISERNGLEQKDTKYRQGIERESKIYGAMDKKLELMKEEKQRVDTALEMEKHFIQQLMEKNRTLDNEMIIREEEERELKERIYRLEMAQEELENTRRERERLEMTIEKKIEYERLREKKLSLMKIKERELADEMDNKKYLPKREESQNGPMQSVAGFGTPRIPPFLGLEYKVWRIEVDSIIHSGLYHEVLLSQALRSSLKGDTKRILLTIDPMASSQELLDKLEDIYGTTQTEDTIMQELFNAKQHEKESTADWALRLESIMQLALETGEILCSKKNSLLKQRFWKGLQSEKLRSNTRVTYESEATFETLRKKTRLEEYELQKHATNNERIQNKGRELRESYKEVSREMLPHTDSLDSKQASNNKNMDLLQTLLGKMEKLEVEMASLRKETANKNRNEGYKKGFNYNKNWQKKDDGNKEANDKDEKQKDGKGLNH